MQTGKIVPWVFHRAGQPISSFRKAWKGVCGQVSRAHPARLPPHGGPNLVRAGVPEKTAMQLTGHKTRSVFDRYDIVDEPI